MANYRVGRRRDGSRTPAAGRPRRPGGGPFRNRARKRWAIAAAVAGTWLVLLALTGSVVAASALMLVLALLGIVVAVALRGFGIGPNHPFARSLATRPWRDGRDVLQIAIRHLPGLFIVTPKNSVLAPSAIELRMNPADLDSLADAIDLATVQVLVAEAYQAEIAARSARTANGAPVEVTVIADQAVPLGRHVLRQRRQPTAQAPVGVAGARDGFTLGDAGLGDLGFGDPGFGFGDAELTDSVLTDEPTLSAPAGNPMLRLVTGGSIAQTRVSGARAGRGRAVELRLPGDPAVSREHAKFTCEDGEWRITSLGRNGVVVNGDLVTGERQVRDGDLIRWGRQADALISQVEIAGGDGIG